MHDNSVEKYKYLQHLNGAEKIVAKLFTLRPMRKFIDQEVAEGGSQPVQVMLQCNYAVGEKLDVHLVLAVGPGQHHWFWDLCPHGNCCRLNR